MEKSVRFSAVQSRLLWFFSLLRNLRGGLRIAFWLPVSRSAFRTTPTDYAVLAAFNVLVWIIGSGLRTGTEGGLNPSALPGMFTIIPVMLLVCLILSRLFRDASLLLAFAVMLGSTDLVFEVAGTAIFTVFETVWSDGPPLTQMSVYLLYVAWAVASVIRTQAILVPWGRRRSGIAALLLTAMVLGMAYIPRDEPWNTPDATQEDNETNPGLMQEEIFHVQGAVLGRDLAQLSPERPGVEDLYFLGAAPFSRQDTFVHELSVVKQLMDERFETGGRSLALVNHAGTVGAMPIATVTNLRLSLSHLGRVMNTEEDMLFLFLTTHGSENHQLAFEFPPMKLQQLTPTALSRMLSDSGIKWKVLVISACYSGGYIEPLKDANTLIITASDETHTSFGCEPDSEFTWFSRAFFDQALRNEANAGTFSLTNAFQRARTSVADMEVEKKLEPSNPQMFVGAAMRDKLKSLEARLAKLAPPATPMPAPPLGNQVNLSNQVRLRLPVALN